MPWPGSLETFNFTLLRVQVELSGHHTPLSRSNARSEFRNSSINASLRRNGRIRQALEQLPTYQVAGPGRAVAAGLGDGERRPYPPVPVFATGQHERYGRAPSPPPKRRAEEWRCREVEVDPDGLVADLACAEQTNRFWSAANLTGEGLLCAFLPPGIGVPSVCRP
jgi:hypothetical protein